MQTLHERLANTAAADTSSGGRETKGSLLNPTYMNAPLASLTSFGWALLANTGLPPAPICAVPKRVCCNYAGVRHLQTVSAMHAASIPRQCACGQGADQRRVTSTMCEVTSHKQTAHAEMAATSTLPGQCHHRLYSQMSFRLC